MKNGKQKMKRLLSVLLCLALVVSFVPGGLLRTSAATVTTPWTSGSSILASSKTTPTG